MNKGGMGVGSSSIMLIFAVLCLTVFSLISLSVAQNDKSLVDIEAKLVTEYYAADELAENILAEILGSDSIPDEIRGVRIDKEWDWDLIAETAAFSCPISDVKQLDVKVAVSDGSYDILIWKMINTGDWVIDDTLNVWSGGDDPGFGFLGLADEMTID